MSRRKRPSDASTVYGDFYPNSNKTRGTLTETMYHRVLTELSVNRFKWVGMPDTIDERFLELTLFRQALCVFYFDKDVDRYMALRAAGVGKLNMYDNPTQFMVIGNSMVSKTLTAKECVPIWGNFLRYPDNDIVLLYANKLANIDRTIEINLLGSRHSHVLFVDENERLSYVNLMRQQAEGQPILFGAPGLSMEKIQSFNIGIDKDVVLNLMLAKAKMWNECMTLLGINNSNQDKKERLVSAEVGANDDQVTSARGVALNARMLAAEQINRIFNLSVNVGWNPQSQQNARGAAGLVLEPVGADLTGSGV